MSRRLGVRRASPWWLSRGVYGVLVGDVVTLWSTGFTGVPNAVVSFHSYGQTGLPLVNLCERYAEMLLDKSRTVNVVGRQDAPLVDEEFSVLYPMLHAHMSQSTWPDGTPRETSTVSVFVDGSVVKAVLKDRSFGVCLWASSPTMTNLFSVLEALLNDPAAEWRADRAVPGQKASRVKK